MSGDIERDIDRFDTAIGEHEWINFDTSPDEPAEPTDVQLIYQSDHGTFFVNMELSDAKAVHQAFGRAIAEKEKDLHD